MWDPYTFQFFDPVQSCKQCKFIFAYDGALELLKNVTRLSQEPKISDFNKSWDNTEALRKRAEDDRKRG